MIHMSSMGIRHSQLTFWNTLISSVMISIQSIRIFDYKIIGQRKIFINFSLLFFSEKTNTNEHRHTQIIH